MEKRDYIIDQIEKIAQLIAALMGGRKVEPERVSKALADLTGFNPDLFTKANTESLGAILKMLDDDNKKALIVHLLLAKDPDLFGQIGRDIMREIDFQQLHPKVKALQSFS